MGVADAARPGGASSQRTDVAQRIGHEHASTTSLYTAVSSDFRTRTLRAALDATIADMHTADIHTHDPESRP